MSCVLFILWLVSLLIFISYGICFRISNNLKPISSLKFYSKINDLNVLNETIYGLSSGVPEGGCAVAVIRISGPNSLHTLNLLTKNVKLTSIFQFINYFRVIMYHINLDLLNCVNYIH